MKVNIKIKHSKDEMQSYNVPFVLVINRQTNKVKIMVKGLND